MWQLKIICPNQQENPSVSPLKQLKSLNNWTTDLVLLGMIFLIFYTVALGSYPLFTPDEGRYSEVAREMVASGDFITPRVNGVAFLDKPVLYYWLQALAISLFGIQEWALRLFPALFGVLGCLITYFCGRHLFDRRTGILSAFILASSPLYFVSAHYANLDLEVAILISCSLLFFITGIQKSDKSLHCFLILAYCFSGLAFLTKGLIGIVFPAMIIGIWIILLSQWKCLLRMHLIKGLIIFAIIVLPWYYLVQQANPAFLHYFFITQQVTRFLSAAEFNNPIPFWFYLPVILIGFFPWTSFLLQAITGSIRKITQARHSHQIELFLLIWIVVVFLFFSIPRSKIITYILPLFPALALLVGNYLSRIFHAKENNLFSGMLILTIFSLIIAGALFSLAHYQLFNLAATLTPYIYIAASIFIVSAFLSLLLIKQNNVLPVFICMTTCSVLFLLTLIMSAAHLNQNSAKPLVSKLKTIIQPQDEVVNYYKFYQDVPIYLEKRITLVAEWNSPTIANKDNWIRELWYGMPFQNTADWLITENIFWQRWNSHKRIFVFLGENYMDQFTKHTSHYYFIAKNNGILLLSNKP